MNGIEVQLTDMMQCRDRRVQIQNDYIVKYHCPVISFCMNIPGPIKTTEKIKNAFSQGKDSLLKELEKHKIEILQTVELHEPTGDEILLAVRFPAEKLKQITTEIEETHLFGRLFDMDVIDVNGEKLSRPSYRKCIICECQAQECARSRKHTIAEMQAKIEAILESSC